MTREELKSRCVELAAHGDAAAAATLELFRELEEFQNKGKFVGIKVGGQVVDGIIPRDFAHVPPPRNQAALEEAMTREPKPGAEPTAEQVAGIQALAKEFGLAENEKVAAAATRKAMGLPPAMDAAVLQANPETKTGGFEKIPGENKEGNKE